jgi:hypothetical protein
MSTRRHSRLQSSPRLARPRQEDVANCAYVRRFVVVRITDGHVMSLQGFREPALL